MDSELAVAVVWTELAPLLALIGTLLAALIAAGSALWLRRKNQSLENQKLQWEKEKLQLTWNREEAAKREASEAEETSREAESRRLKSEADSRVHTLDERAARYRARLIAELSRLKILDMSRPLNLQDIYVHVRVREQQPLKYVSADQEVNKPDKSGQIGPPETQVVIDGRRTAPLVLDPGQALLRFKHVAVIGDPGAGKTTMLRHLAFITAQGNGGRLPDLPVFIELRNFVDSGEQDLLTYVAALWQSHYGFAESSEYLNDRLTAGRATLLLDGLDEVLGGGSREDANNAYGLVAKEVDRLATLYPDAPIAITCRRHGWRGGLETFTVLEALDFDETQIRSFVENWFSSDETKAQHLVRVLERNLRVHMLAANPLMLSLIAIVFERDLELPERRAALYRRCVDVLLRDWDAHRGIRRFSTFTVDRKHDLMREIAWHFHLAGARYFPEDELQAVVAGFLPTVGISPEESTHIIEEIAEQYGLLKAQAVGYHGFMHLTLQEYFASLAALEHSNGLNELVLQRHDPWWEEVLLLFSGNMPDASPLILAVWKAGGTSSASDDLFHRDLLLAGRCLAASRRVGDVGVRSAVTDAIRELLTATDIGVIRRNAAGVLVEIAVESRSLTTIVSILVDSTVSQRVHEALLEEIGVSGLTELAPQVLDLARAGKGIWFDAAVMKALREIGNPSVVPGIKRLTKNGLSLASGADASVTMAAFGAVSPTELILHAKRKEKKKERQLDHRSLISITSEAFAALPSVSVDDLQDWWDFIFAHRRDLFETQELVLVYLRRAGEDGLRRLLDVLGSPSSSPRLKFAIALAIRNPLDISLTSSTLGELLAGVTRRGQPWTIGWALLEALDNQPGDPRELRRLISGGLPQELEIGMVATLGAWGYPDDTGLLRRAILDELVSPDLSFAEGGSSWALSGIVWNRIVGILVKFGDLAFVESLFAQARPFQVSTHGSVFDAEESVRPEKLRHLARLDGIRTLDLVEGIQPVGFLMGYDWYWSTLVAATNTQTALRVVRLLGAALLSADSRDSWHVSAIVDAVGQVGETDAIPELFALLQSGSHGGVRPDAAYTAIFDISKRNRLRVFEGGRLEGDTGESVSDEML